MTITASGWTAGSHGAGAAGATTTASYDWRPRARSSRSTSTPPTSPAISRPRPPWMAATAAATRTRPPSGSRWCRRRRSAPTPIICSTSRAPRWLPTCGSICCRTAAWRACGCMAARAPTGRRWPRPAPWTWAAPATERWRWPGTTPTTAIPPTCCARTARATPAKAGKPGAGASRGTTGASSSWPGPAASNAWWWTPVTSRATTPTAARCKGRCCRRTSASCRNR